MKILLAVDGSENSLHAVEFMIKHAAWYREAPRVELVTVHLPVLKAAGIQFTQRVLVGLLHIADTPVLLVK